MLYLFCYVLRVKSWVSLRRQKDFLEDFDIDDFIRRMTLATGLEVQPAGPSADGDNCRLAIKNAGGGG